MARNKRKYEFRLLAGRHTYINYDGKKVDAIGKRPGHEGDIITVDEEGRKKLAQDIIHGRVVDLKAEKEVARLEAEKNKALTDQVPNEDDDPKDETQDDDPKDETQDDETKEE
jgi:hypothetical protein